jgi:peptidoglycan/LPS O-acetylase OafA/YrhL
MTRATSLFLDVLRLAAALVVFFAHTTHYWNPGLLGPMQVWAHDAVIVFFVLSGYVIAHTTRDVGRDARLYTVARLSRLYSVVVPALVLTAVLWVIGRELDPELYANYERAHPWVRFGVSAVFLNEVWMRELSPPTNTPFWSLGYEAWYYVFFGLMLFVKSRGWRWLLLGASALVAGPNVLMLLPVWLVGVAAYVWSDVGRLSRGVTGAGLVLSVSLTVFTLRSLPDWPETPGAAPWYFAGAAVSDLIGGLGWGAIIWFFNRVFADTGVPAAIYRPVRWMAGHTFSLYLYHAPLVILATALAPPFMVKGIEWAPMVVILLLVFGLGAATESQRGRWQRGFCWGWDRLSPRRRTNDGGQAGSGQGSGSRSL